MNTSYNQILQLLQNGQKISAKELREKIAVSESLIHRQLKRLLSENKIQKIGSPPKVWYEKISEKQVSFSSDIIKENWLEIKANGAFIYGEEGFEYWCKQRGFYLEQKIEEFESLFKEQESLKSFGLIQATEKISKTFKQNFLEEVYYIDFYSLPIFGKTLLGKLVLYAKQNSDIELMKIIAKKIENPLKNFIERENFDMIVVIPHSVPRKRDFLSTTLSFLHFLSPQKIFTKVFQDHCVAQKTLKSKEERQENASQTLFLTKKVFSQKILLIDDACGSGATLNIAAQKIKEVSKNSKIYALTFVGSQKGFEVISET